MTETETPPNTHGESGLKEKRPTATGEQGHTGPRRRAPELRLPRGVLVRVDVFVDGSGRFRAFTRERLTPGRGGDRNEVASILVKTGLDVLNQFADEQDDRSEEPVAHPEVATRIGSQGPLPDPDLQRLYG